MKEYWSQLYAVQTTNPLSDQRKYLVGIEIGDVLMKLTDCIKPMTFVIPKRHFTNSRHLSTVRRATIEPIICRLLQVDQQVAAEHAEDGRLPNGGQNILETRSR